MLAQVYQQLSAQALREELILGNLSLVRHFVGRLLAKLPPRVDLDNLHAAGTLGLVEAANRFDSGRGVAFQTFAYTRIRGAIYDELRRNCPFPQEILEHIAKVRRVLQTSTPPVTPEFLAENTGLTVDQVTECLAALRMTRTLSLDQVTEPNTNVRTCGIDRPEHRLEDIERKNLLSQAITELPERERLAVTLYYMEDLRLKEIGHVLGLSESRVSRLLKCAEHRIEEYIRAKETGADWPQEDVA